MINALHLIWIIPISVWFGFFLACLFHAAGDADEKARSGTDHGRHRLRPINHNKEKSAK